MGLIRARFNRDTVTTDALRDALIEDGLDDLSTDDLEDIMERYWDDFKPLAVRWLDRKWNDGASVWVEAAERGWLDPEWDDEQ
jgi:hypothetical protein